MRHDDSVHGAVFSSDGHRIITASEDKTARLWDAERGQLIGEPMRHGEGVRSAAFSPDGRRVVTASGDTAKVWELFPTMDQNLVDEAKAITPICLRRQQRDQYYLAPEPPDWCITGSGGSLDSDTDPEKWQPKWPYHTKAWKDWLIAKRVGKILPLPWD
jgi:WD40 repeat protein